MRSLLFIFAALISLIYAADPVGTFTSPCMGPLVIHPNPADPTETASLYAVETVTLTDGHQFESETQFHYEDPTCGLTSFMLLGRNQGTFETKGDQTAVEPTNPTTPITVQGIDVHRTHYFVTPLNDNVANLLQGLCLLPTKPAVKVPLDIHYTGCQNLGVLGNDTCPTFHDIYYVNGSNMQFGLQFLNVTTCSPLARQNLLNPLPYTPLAAPTLASGKYELGCSFFQSSIGGDLYNTYLLEITSTSATSGKYSLTSHTFNAATCAQAALFSTTVLSATYTVDGYAVVQNNMLDGKRPIQVNLDWTSKKVTPNTDLAALALGGTTFCSPLTFQTGQATELNNDVGCIKLGFPPVTGSSPYKCPTHYDVVQEKLDASGFYPGGATEFVTHCSKATRVDTVSAKNWNTYVEPTATPTPTSSSSSLAANVLLLISLLVFVFHF